MLNEDDAGRLYSGTLHGFCMRHLLRPYFWASDGYKRGFRVAAPDSEEYRCHAREAIGASGILKASVAVEMEHVGRALDGAPVFQPPLTRLAVLEFWRRMQADGLIDFATMLYESWRIIERLPAVARGIASRYAWILVDEFQDTTDVQCHVLLRIAAERRTRFMIVGDPCQSIFRFAGARPEHFDLFARETGVSSITSFSENWRCSARVVALAEAIIPRTPRMRAVGEDQACALTPKWVSCADAAASILDHILPELSREGIALGQTAVLSAWFFPLFHVGRALRAGGVPIVGPGARPYKRRHLAAPLAECLAACATVGRAGSRFWVRRELVDLIRQLSSDVGSSVYLEGLDAVVRTLVRAARTLKRSGADAREWLLKTASMIGDSLSAAELIAPRDALRIAESGRELVTDAEDANGLAGMSVESLAEFVRPTNHVHLLTVHRAKGREFDAVILIDAHHKRFPHWSAVTQEDIDDGRRLLYVALTRARRSVYVLTGHDSYGAAPSRFLTERALPLDRVSV